ncbi:MAG: hypothetical protein WD021_10760 [Rhodothermales bacterium]
MRTILVSLLAAAGVLVLKALWTRSLPVRRASGRMPTPRPTHGPTHEDVVDALSDEEKERLLEELGGQVYGHV